MEWIQRPRSWSVAGLAAMLATAVVTWPFLPDSLPIHYTGSRLDGCTSKDIAVLFLPVSTGVMYVVMGVLHQPSATLHMTVRDSRFEWLRAALVGVLASLYAGMQRGFWSVTGC